MFWVRKLFRGPWEADFGGLVEADENRKKIAFFTLYILTEKHVMFVPSSKFSYVNHLSRV